MKNIKICALTLAVLLVFGCFSFVGCGKKLPVTVNDVNGELMATPEKTELSAYNPSVSGCESYVDIVLDEAVSILRELYGYDKDEVEKALFKNGYTIQTAFDPDIYNALYLMASNYGYNSMLSIGCAVTDLEGNLCAVYSSSETNFATALNSPHSSFKPLSVYAPAMEKGIIDWSTQIVDMPYMSVENADGTYSDWPANATGTYSGMKTSLYEGIKHSLNTMAVHVLHEYGVLESMKFLTESFGIDLSYEQSRMAVKGEDEIIGNIALGSLYTGVSPVDMAGYYQIFANGGKYEKPHTVLEITDSNGESIYKHVSEPKQVISEQTSYIMNRLLAGVVEMDGTGEAAYSSKVEVVGKTGTGDYNESNWFVGVTPEYSIAVWHSDGSVGNIAAEMFSTIITYMPESTLTKFPLCRGVKKAVYCAESGLMFSESCNRMQIGYYVDGSAPGECGGH